MLGYIKKELGDYQTPQYFADRIVEIVFERISFKPHKIIEPTCGLGSFLLASAQKFPRTQMLGIDINQDYLEQARQTLLAQGLKQSSFELLRTNIFDFDYSSWIQEDDAVLLIGNPPWGCNSLLSNGLLNNLPRKQNSQGLSGLDALTGASNFDLAESIILSSLKEIKARQLCLAMLCKTGVAIKLLTELKRAEIGLSKASLFKFDAKEVFAVSVDACLIFLEIDQAGSSGLAEYEVYNLVNGELEYDSLMGFSQGNFFLNEASYDPQLDGHCAFEWRQGIKHDLSKVMQLEQNEQGQYFNGFQELVKIEEDLLYPLLKSSDISKYNRDFTFRRYLIVTQNKLGQDTSYIKQSSPKLWAYLNKYKDLFLARKSRIYQKAPDFAIFGIGAYAFARYKLAISGFYKDPVVKLLEAEKAIMLDDTCYFLSFEQKKTALISAILLSSEIAKSFLISIANLAAKRPFTKRVLARLNLLALARMIDFPELKWKEQELFQSNILSLADYEAYQANLSLKGQ